MVKLRLGEKEILQYFVDFTETMIPLFSKKRKVHNINFSLCLLLIVYKKKDAEAKVHEILEIYNLSHSVFYD
jgi:hypothetical protein